MSDKLDTRILEEAELEFREALPEAADPGADIKVVRSQVGRLGGYAVRWDALSGDLGGFRETFTRGAFADVLGSDVAALVDHDMSKLLGRTSAGTLRLAEDDFGLRYEIDLPRTSLARDLAENVRLGNIRGSSFAFQVPKDGETVGRRKGEPLPVRTVNKVSRLRDVGPVTFPAYPDSSAAMRSIEAYLAEEAAPPVVDEAALAAMGIEIQKLTLLLESV